MLEFVRKCVHSFLLGEDEKRELLYMYKRLKKRVTPFASNFVIFSKLKHDILAL